MRPLPSLPSPIPTCAVISPHPPPFPLLALSATTSPLAPQPVVPGKNLRTLSYLNVAPALLCVPSEHPPLRQAVANSKATTVTPISNTIVYNQKLPYQQPDHHCELPIVSPERNCFSHWHIKKGIGTKSAYVHPHPHHHLCLKSPYSCGGGAVIHVSLLARHGTRNPTRGHLSRLRELERFLYQQVAIGGIDSNCVPEWLHEFSMRIEEWERGPGSLTKEGEQELREIGRRFRQRYHKHLSQCMRVRSSYKPRAVASAQAFLEGYGHDIDAEIDILEPGKRDGSVRFYDATWNKQYASFASMHKDRMRKSPYGDDAKAQLIAEKITQSLGCRETLTHDHLRQLVECCGIERAQNRIPLSELCSVFTREDLMYLEQFEKRYSPFFRGHELFNTLTAPLLQDLMRSLQASAQKGEKNPDSCSPDISELSSSEASMLRQSTDNDIPSNINMIDNNGSAFSADLRFAHAETLVPFLLLMGISGVDGASDLRFMSPFAGNLMIELWTPPTDGPNFGAGHRVKFRLHERYVERIDAVNGGRQGWLELDSLIEFFSNVLQEAV